MEAPERVLKAELVAIRSELPDYIDADMLDGVVTSCTNLPDTEVERFLGDFCGPIPSLPRVVQKYLNSRNTIPPSSSSSSSSLAHPSASGLGGGVAHMSGVPGASLGKGNPTSVLGPVLQAYVKPKPERGAHQGDARKGGAKPQHQGSLSQGQGQAQGGEGGGSEQAAGGAPGRSRKGGKKKAVDLSALDQGKVVFKQGQPCECQAGRHGLVNNCLGCGRVVCEQEGEGPCLFCGRIVARAGSELAVLEEQAVLSESAQPSSQTVSLGLPGHEGGQQGLLSQQEEATRRAIAFKDRLVEYDRTSAQRTAVIDDQSDYFEIDGDSWLTEEERGLLRRREEEKRKADEDRRRKVVVTFDLIGRRVMLQDPAAGAYVGVPGAPAHPETASLPQFRTEAQPLAATGEHRPPTDPAHTLSNSHQQHTDSQAGPGRLPGRGTPCGTPGVHPGAALGSGGLGILGPLDPQHREETAFRMAPSPNLRIAAPVFTGTLHSSRPAGADSATAGKAHQGAGTGQGPNHGSPDQKLGGGSSQGGKGKEGQGRGVKGGSVHRQEETMVHIRSTRDAPRVQHETNLGASLGRALGTVSSSSAVTQGGGGSVQAGAGPFDICSGAPEANGALPPLVRLQLGPAGAGPGEDRSRGGARVLQDGMVLLKGWLSLPQQAEIVTACRELGVGPGGFYLPKLANGAEMKLRMMCLGKHWEPNLKAYETTRSFFDNAVPPQIPDRFHALTGAALEAAQQADPKGLPTMTPQVCIVNFYSGGGSLGMHQDKDESISTVRRGSPVVSFSIGDSAVFLYGRERLAETASKVTLDSGDVLVFGGPSRLVFHGVPEVLPHSAPQELVAATGLRPGRLNLTFREL